MIDISNRLNEINDECSSIFSDTFTIETLPALIVPTVEDTSLTYKNATSDGKTVKEINTTIIHIDIRESTILNQTCSSDDLVKLYSSFTWGVIKCAELFSGRVRNITGDRLTILFNSNNCFANAIQTAILLNTFSKYVLNPSFKQAEIKCGIGIDYGPMIVTKVGSIRKYEENQTHQDLVWLGRPANIASKLADRANKENFLTKVISKSMFFSSTGLTTLEKELNAEQFLEGIEPTSSFPMIGKFKDPLILSFCKKMTRSSFKPILMTQEVFNGFIKQMPQHDSLTKEYWQARQIKDMPGYEGLIHEADIHFVIPGITAPVQQSPMPAFS